MLKRNLPWWAKGVVIGEAYRTFSADFRWNLDLHILFLWRLTLHNKKAYFAKQKEMRVFTRGESRKRTWAGKLEVEFSFFPSLLSQLRIFLSFFPDWFLDFVWAIVNSISPFRELNFPASFRGILCHETCQGFRYCVSLVGGLTTLSARFEEVRKLNFFSNSRFVFTRVISTLTD